MNEFVAVTSTNIARILNLYPRKGAILPGADADIVVWDPEGQEDDLGRQAGVGDRLQRVRGRSRCRACRAITLSRGEVVATEGKVAGEPGRGRFVKREPFSPRRAR